MYIKSPFQGYSMYNQSIIQEDLTDFPPNFRGYSCFAVPALDAMGAWEKHPCAMGQRMETKQISPAKNGLKWWTIGT